MESKAKLAAVLLECGEFFRDELAFGVCTPFLESKFQELRGKAFDALGNPSVLDCQKIKSKGKKE